MSFIKIATVNFFSFTWHYVISGKVPLQLRFFRELHSRPLPAPLAVVPRPSLVRVPSQVP